MFSHIYTSTKWFFLHPHDCLWGWSIYAEDWFKLTIDWLPAIVRVFYDKVLLITSTEAPYSKLWKYVALTFLELVVAAGPIYLFCANNGYTQVSPTLFSLMSEVWLPGQLRRKPDTLPLLALPFPSVPSSPPSPPCPLLPSFPFPPLRGRPSLPSPFP